MPYIYDNYLSEPITQVKGKAIRFQADFTIHDFSNANEFYCGVRVRVRVCVCMHAGAGVWAGVVYPRI